VPNPFQATFLERSNIAPGVFDLRFAVTSQPQLDFKAGQFVTLHVPAENKAGFLRRSYSIASPAFRGDHLRLIVRRIPTGPASDYLIRLAQGDVVTMAGPLGLFVLAESHPGDVVFGTTGTGIATIMPMLEELARARGHVPGRTFVHWGLRREEDIFLRQELEDLCHRAGAELHIHLSAAEPVWTGQHGRINTSVLGRMADLSAPVFYLVGNGAMVSELRTALVELGLDRKHQIRTEAFFD
jgi:ferredoxin-NADP reductase